MVRRGGGVAVLGACLALLRCGGSAPAPSLDDYSRGVSRLVDGLAPLFVDSAGVEVPRPEGARTEALDELAARWRAASGPGRQVRLRIVDFSAENSRAARVRVEVQLTGASMERPAERVAAVAELDLALEKSSSSGDWKLARAVLPRGPVTFQRGRPHLVEQAGERGLAAIHEPFDPAENRNYCIPATHHRPGVLLVDVDGDGALDVILPSIRPRLFLNDGAGHFRDATRGSGLDRIPPGEASGGVAADLDGDGLPEVLLTYHNSPTRLFKNEGGGKLRDVTEAWGLAGLAQPSTAAVFFDADGDGRLDLFIACYGDARKTGPAYDGLNGERDRFYHQVERNGHPFFVDATAAAGLGDLGWGLAASACDFDDDGDDDLYVANDFGLHSLFENRSTRGHPYFVNIAKESGTEDEGDGMGVTWGDYDGDGKWDLHVANYWTPYRWILRDHRWPMPPLAGAFLVRPMMAKKMAARSRGDSLFRNLGGRRFERTSEAAGVADGGWAWGTEFVDLDGKGREDLLVVNGMYQATTGVDDEVSFWNAMGREGVKFHDGIWGGIDFGVNGMASRTPKKLFWNRGDGTFEERAWVEGFDTLEDTRGLAFGDLDGDGAPEIVVSCFRGPLLVYGNGWTRGEGGGRVVLRLGMANGFNRDAIGAVVRLWAGGKVQLREVRAGSSYLSQSSHDLLFGIGTNEKAERIEVRWPDGKREELNDIPAGSRVTWMQGESPKRDLLRK
jgi:enediyne biosynthesis protein E4